LERWPRGRRRRFAKPLYGLKPVSGVRISPSPQTNKACTPVYAAKGAIGMGKKSLAWLSAAVMMSAFLACGRQPLTASSPDSSPGTFDSGVRDGAKDIGNATGGTGGATGGTGGAAIGTGGQTGAGGIGFPFVLPDGGLSALLGDSGLINGILDAPRDSLLGQIICPPEIKLGDPCSATSLIPGCMLPNLGGACYCLNGFYLCPSNAAPLGPCPQGAATAAACSAPLTTCLTATGACVCLLGTYSCI
jgi:hypothetical protein